MNTLLISTAYLPTIDYINAIAQAAETQIELHENFQKRSYRNRAIILSANGPLPLSIPVKKPEGNHTPIAEILIDYSESWQHDHWQAIQSAYNKSPYFEYYNYLFEPFYSKKWDTLLEFNTTLLHQILKILSIQKSISQTDVYVQKPTETKDCRDLYRTHKLGESLYKIEPYLQVFDYKQSFVWQVSIVDTLFNLGPDTNSYLQRLK